ncbi:SRPBCC family protein [Reinekea marina]|uniref:SRPBCC family protein n=1 Tax=Reinekea marina TaxID=1310421 RepID=A0ABV7WRP8_9GAMM|nr:SRPBCC family protein [Reinekea marina]MDN3647715.1 SRPBCC family protein [Reinekea marina]
MQIAIETTVNATLSQAWNAWVTPDDIIQWNFASADWACPKAEIDLRVGGRFSYRMEAKDGSMGFDFEGEFVAIEPNKSIRYKLEDSRQVLIEFIEVEAGVKIMETFDAENENTIELQRTGWLAILNNFKRHVENSHR